ncbi:hypothetical protein HY990_02675 [Candidatus Micrarchaeota archaeon]|nr:hypothetical protein [Candidatus Micrarchaeota archaeon]
MKALRYSTNGSGHSRNSRITEGSGSIESRCPIAKKPGLLDSHETSSISPAASAVCAPNSSVITSNKCTEPKTQPNTNEETARAGTATAPRRSVLDRLRTRGKILLLAATMAISACAKTVGYDLDFGQDARVDASDLGPAQDRPKTDAAQDESETGMDAQADTGMDSGIEAGADGGLDAQDAADERDGPISDAQNDAEDRPVADANDVQDAADASEDRPRTDAGDISDAADAAVDAMDATADRTPVSDADDAGVTDAPGIDATDERVEGDAGTDSSVRPPASCSITTTGGTRDRNFNISPNSCHRYSQDDGNPTGLTVCMTESLNPDGGVRGYVFRVYCDSSVPEAGLPDPRLSLAATATLISYPSMQIPLGGCSGATATRGTTFLLTNNCTRTPPEGDVCEPSQNWNVSLSLCCLDVADGGATATMNCRNPGLYHL